MATVWDAWPEGFIAKRGIQTIGRWTLRQVFPETENNVGLMVWDQPLTDTLPPDPALIPVHDGRWFDPGIGWAETKWMQAQERGDLFPFLNQSDDPATWNATLWEMAEKVREINQDRMSSLLNLRWRREASMLQKTRWRLHTDDIRFGAILCELQHETEDPREALIEMRALLEQGNTGR